MLKSSKWQTNLTRLPKNKKGSSGLSKLPMQKNRMLALIHARQLGRVGYKAVIATF